MESVFSGRGIRNGFTIALKLCYSKRPEVVSFTNKTHFFLIVLKTGSSSAGGPKPGWLLARVLVYYKVVEGS